MYIVRQAWYRDAVFPGGIRPSQIRQKVLFDTINSVENEFLGLNSSV
jgi:hypothetical protein